MDKQWPRIQSNLSDELTTIIQNLAGRPARLVGLLALAVGGILGFLVPNVSDTWLLFGGLIGFISLLVILRRPDLGLLALVFITYTRLSDILVHDYGLPSIAKIFVPMLLGIILLRWVLFKERPAGWQRAALLLAVYGAVGLVSLFFAANTARTQAGLIAFVKDSLIVIAIAMLLKWGVLLRRIVWTLLGTGIFLGTISVIQQITGTFENTYWGFGQARIKNIVGDVSGYRIAGPIGSPNFFALVMVVLVPLALERLWHSSKKTERLLAGWALAVSVLTIIFTFSRGGFLALVVTLVLMFVRRPPRPAVLLVTGGLIVLLWQYVPAQYTERLATLVEFFDDTPVEEVSFRGRSSEVLTAWLMFVDHPFVGVGFDDFKSYYQTYAQRIGLEVRNEERSAHNLYLEVAAETGLMGLFAFGAILWFMFRGMRAAKKSFTEAGLSDYASMVGAFSVGWIGYLTGSLFLHMAFPRYFWLLVGIALAMPQVAANELALVRSGVRQPPGGLIPEGYLPDENLREVVSAGVSR